MLEKPMKKINNSIFRARFEYSAINKVWAHSFINEDNTKY